MKGNRSRATVLYLVTNTVNEKHYVGVTTRDINRRMSEHMCHAVKKNGQGAFYRAVRKYGRAAFMVDILGYFDTAHAALAAEVAYIAQHQPEYNSTQGGDAGNGGNLTAAGRAKISLTSKGNQYAKGLKHSTETKDRLRQLGHANAALFQQYASLGPASMARCVRCLDDGSEWPSASAAARHFAVAKSALIELCLKNPRRKTVGGFRFEYVEA